METFEILLKTAPTQLMLVAIVLLAFAVSPLGRKLKKKTASYFASDPNVTGTGLVLMLEDAKAPVPRHWVDFVDGRIDHKMRNVINSLESHMETTREKLDGLDDIARNLNEVQVAVARIEGMLDRRHR